jgi:hypothetical protein
VFLPEVFELGALCVGYNLPFDLVRLAVRCAAGIGRHRDTFRVELRRHSSHPFVRLQIVSNKQAFIKFAPVPPPIRKRRKKQKRRQPGRHTFHGRFLDLRQAVYALTGDSGSLEADCAKFGVEAAKLPVPMLGTITPELLPYNTHDTEVLTARLFEAVWQDFLQYADVVTTDSDYYRELKKRATELYSPATVGKVHLDLMGLVPPPLLVVLRICEGE